MEVHSSSLWLYVFLPLSFILYYPKSAKDNIHGNNDYIISFSNLMYLASVTFSSINSGVVNIDSKT